MVKGINYFKGFSYISIFVSTLISSIPHFKIGQLCWLVEELVPFGIIDFRQMQFLQLCHSKLQ